MGRRRKLLVPEARMALQTLKAEVVREKKATLRSDVADQGALTTSEAGTMGGEVGGQMIQRLVALAKEDLAKEDLTKHR